MAVKVLIPTPLQKFTRNQATLECEGSSIGELLETLETTFPGIKARLCDEQGELRRFINFYVNSEDIRFLEGKATALSDGDEVSIVPAVAGGSDEALAVEPTPKSDAKAGETKAAKPKKEKAPALEDKPFAEFINQDFLPKLQQTLTKVGFEDLQLKLVIQKIPIKGLDATWSQVMGTWRGDRQFIILFSKEDIQAPKYFCAADYGSAPSTLESFMIDERKVTLDLLLLYTTQRLNGQKWLVRN